MKRLSAGWFLLVVVCVSLLLFNFMQLEKIPNSIECLAKIYRNPANVRLPSEPDFQYEEEAADILLDDWFKKTQCPNISNVQRVENLDIEFKTIGTDPQNYVTSAFYQGPSITHHPSVYITGSFQGIETAYCHIWFKEYPTQIVIEGKFILFLDAHKKKDSESVKRYAIRCELPTSHRVPEAVSVSSEKCPRQHVTVPIVRPVKTLSNQFSVGACLSYVTDDPSLRRLMEWVEMHLHFGVGHITAFETIDTDSLFLMGLDTYEKDNVMKVIKYNFPPNIGTGDLEKTLIGDCILRNMYRYKRLVIFTNNDVLLPSDLSPGSFFSVFNQQITGVTEITGVPQGKISDELLLSKNTIKLINMAALFSDNKEKKTTISGMSAYTFADCDEGFDKCASLFDVIRQHGSDEESESLVAQLSQRVQERMQIAKQLDSVL